jgi:hypothetical protein
MQCSELELVFEQDGIPPLAPEAREHLATCNACKQYVDEVTAIVAVAHQFPAEVDPPQRIWVSLRNQLESEGIIHDAQRVVVRVGASWWGSFADLFRTRVLATASVAALLIAAVGISLRPPSTQILEAHDDSFSNTVRALNETEGGLPNVQLAGTNVSSVDASLRQNLQQVNDFIADCEHRVREVPSDQLTREYLTNAYEQKAQLLGEILDRGRSLN